MRRARAWVLSGAALLIAAAVTWYVASPWWTLRQMAAAAQAHDADKLSGYIDYPKLRASTKEQIKSGLNARLVSGTGFDKGLGALGLMAGLAMADEAVDTMITPEGVTAIFAADKARAGASTVGRSGTEPKAEKPMGLDAANREIVRDGLDGFRLHENGKVGQDGDLIFERHGLSWKLARIQVPAQLFSAP